MQSDWLKPFWPISQEQDFSLLWDLCRIIANNKHFIEQIQRKLMTNFFFKFKNPIFQRNLMIEFQENTLADLRREG